jgi:hypothetical protein
MLATTRTRVDILNHYCDSSDQEIHCKRVSINEIEHCAKIALQLAKITPSTVGIGTLKEYFDTLMLTFGDFLPNDIDFFVIGMSLQKSDHRFPMFDINTLLNQTLRNEATLFLEPDLNSEHCLTYAMLGNSNFVNNVMSWLCNHDALHHKGIGTEEFRFNDSKFRKLLSLWATIKKNKISMFDISVAPLTAAVGATNHLKEKNIFTGKHRSALIQAQLLHIWIPLIQKLTTLITHDIDVVILGKEIFKIVSPILRIWNSECGNKFHFHTVLHPNSTTGYGNKANKLQEIITSPISTRLDRTQLERVSMTRKQVDAQIGQILGPEYLKVVHASVAPTDKEVDNKYDVSVYDFQNLQAHAPSYETLAWAKQL